MDRNALIRLIEGTLESDIPFNLTGADTLADYILAEIAKADTRGYFRAMRDIQSGAVAQLNSI